MQKPTIRMLLRAAWLLLCKMPLLYLALVALQTAPELMPSSRVPQVVVEALGGFLLVGCSGVAAAAMESLRRSVSLARTVQRNAPALVALAAVLGWLPAGIYWGLSSAASSRFSSQGMELTQALVGCIFVVLTVRLAQAPALVMRGEPLAEALQNSWRRMRGLGLRYVVAQLVLLALPLVGVCLPLSVRLGQHAAVAAFTAVNALLTLPIAGVFCRASDQS